MPRREIALYDSPAFPRAPTNEHAITKAKRTPKYVHGKVGMSMLLHRIAYVELWWNELVSGTEVRRLKHPKMIARTECGSNFFLEAGRAGTCDMPAPEAVICLRCEGGGVNFGVRGKTKKTRRQAKDSLGCVTNGTQIDD